MSYLNFATHGMNSIYVTIDVMLSSTPHRILHFWVLQIYAAAFTIFSAIYWAVDNDNVIYDILDYGENPGQATAYTVGLTLVGSPLITFLVFFLYWLRKLLFSGCSNEASGNSVGTEGNSYSMEKQGHDNPSMVV